MLNRRTIIRLALLLLAAGLLCLGATLLALNLTPRLLPVILGLNSVGSLADALPPDPPPLTWAGAPLERVELLLPPYLPEPLELTAADLGAGGVVGDGTTPGQSVYLLTLDEDALNTLLRRQFPTDSARYRDLWVALQPGGMVVYAQVNLGLRWQRMGLLLLQEGETTLTPTGLVLEGALYTLPEKGSLARTASRVTATVRQTLTALTLTGPLEGEAHLSQMRFHADRLEILAQAAYFVPPPPDTGWRTLETGVELREMDVATGSVVERVVIVRLAPENLRFRVLYEPDHPRPVSAWADESRALLVVNGGYFDPEGHATALLVSGGQRAGVPLGDFAGMFAVNAGGQVSVRWLQEQPYDPAEELVEAVQSFPVLVKPGGVMGFPAEADEGTPARRTIVAQDDAGRILFIVAPRGYLGLHEMAVFLTGSNLEIEIALNLDGGGSTGLWLNSGAGGVEIDSITPVPSVIVIEKQRY